MCRLVLTQTWRIKPQIFKKPYTCSINEGRAVLRMGGSAQVLIVPVMLNCWKAEMHKRISILLYHRISNIVSYGQKVLTCT